MELLWYAFLVVSCLGATLGLGLGYRTPRCRRCRTSAVMLSRQIAESSPPVFEVVYRCPNCCEILLKRFVSTISD